MGRKPDLKWQPPEQPGWRDYWEAAYGILALALGLVILWRVASAGFPLIGVLTAVAFVALGCHRLYYVIKYIAGRRG